MAKRILNMTAEEMTHATKSELIEAIAGSEEGFLQVRRSASRFLCLPM